MLTQGLDPGRALQPARHLSHQLQAGSHTQDDTDPLPIHGIELALGGVLEHPLGHDEGQQLGRIRGGNICRRDAELHGVKVYLGQEGPAPGIGLVLPPWIRIVEVLNQPVVGRDLLQEVGPGHDIAPEPGHLGGSRKEGADTNQGQGRSGVTIQGNFARVGHETITFDL